MAPKRKTIEALLFAVCVMAALLLSAVAAHCQAPPPDPTMQVITGNISDLGGNPVATGVINFQLKPKVSATISGQSRFTPLTYSCRIWNGQIYAGTVASAPPPGPIPPPMQCAIKKNTSLTPAGTYYQVTECPLGACTASFNMYAIYDTIDYSALIPTPTTAPMYGTATVGPKGDKGDPGRDGTGIIDGLASDGNSGITVTNKVAAGEVSTPKANDELWVSADVQAAINSLPAAGGKVHLLPSHTYSITCGVNQINTGSKVVNIEGSGETTVIEGAGCPLVTLASSGSKISNLTIQPTAAHTSTVGVFVGTGTTAEVTRFVIEDVFFNSLNKLEGSAIKTQFGLEGVIRGGETRGWNCGVELTSYNGTHRSNANQLSGVKLRWGKTGLCVGDDDIDNVMIDSATIEGNSVAAISAASGAINIDKSHIEQNGDATHPQVDLKQYAHIASRGNFYGACWGVPCTPVVGQDIRVADGINSSPQLSSADILNGGITHNGTGIFVVRDKVILFSSLGTGTVVDYSGSQVVASRPDWSYVLSGFSWLDFRGAITNTVGNTRLSGYAGRNVVVDDYTGANTVAQFDPATKKTTVYGPLILNPMLQGGKLLCQKTDQSIGYCSGTSSASTCTCN